MIDDVHKIDHFIYSLYFLAFDVRVMKLRMIVWAEHGTRTGKMSCAYKVLVGKSSREKPIWEM
jgi:hypothetical protein